MAEAKDALACPITYVELRDLEKDFEDVETEITRQHLTLAKPLYEKRAKTVSQIPNFWPLVFEQAPADVDQYIQPTDSALFLSSLKNISVSHFEVADGAKGDPRSVAIRFEFDANDYFEDTVLEKKFWHRHSKDGWAGLVSEPVPIRWKEGKDLTDGILALVDKVWEQDRAAVAGPDGAFKPKLIENFSPDEKALKDKIAEIGLGGLSFFTWFGYRGPRVTAEESRAAVEKDREERRLRAEGKADGSKDKEEDEEDDEEEDDSPALEIFPDGEELALAIAEDLWPNAIKYFTQGQEAAELSELDFEELDEMDSIDEEEDEEKDEKAVNGDDAEPPSKKRKA